MKLHLGVLDVAYSTAKTGNPNGGGNETTYSVAMKLEQRYHVMRTFFESRKQKIADFLAESIANSMADMVRGRQLKGSKAAKFSNKFHGIETSYERSSLTYSADQKIENEFRRFIFANEMQKMSIEATGKPLSMAAIKGINHRKKHPYSRKNKERPFLVDTGLFISSFRAWTKD